MKLSQLVDFRNKLKTMPLEAVVQDTNQKLDHLNFHVGSIYGLIPETLEKDLETTKNNIYQAFENYSQQIEQLKNHIQSEIDKQENHWFTESYKLFEVGMSLEKNEDILNRRLSITGENTKHSTYHSEEVLKSRLSGHADWRFPGLVIRPGLENFIWGMVGYDPLYIVDQNYELLKPCMEHFPKLYQNRLRPYLLNDRSDDPILDKVPNGQFGMCLVYNFFNYRPFEIIRRYLEEIYIKLRPGGILLMTYNDCDQSNAVELVERHYACYTPGYLVRDLAKSVGFELTYTWGDDGPSVWLELRKPGELESLRGGQVIATIKDPELIKEDIDFLKRKVYTKEEITKIHEQARKLDIDEDIIVQSKPFDLVLLINEILTKIHLEEKAEEERKRQEYLKNLAIEHNIDYNAENFQELINGLLLKLDEERIAKEIEEKRIAAELERKRIEDVHARAKSLGVDLSTCQTEADIHQQISEKLNERKKQELVLLRQRAMELRAGDPNLIRYGYSAEKLKQLIKEKEEKQ